MEKLKISHEKLAHLKNLSYENGIIGALAIDQRGCLLYTSPSPRDRQKSRMPSSA